MPVQLPFTAFLNHYFAGLANAILALFRVHPHYPQAPIDNTTAMELVVFFVLLLFFVLVRATLSVDKPGPVQHVAEMLNEFVGGQAESIIGHGYEQFVPFVTRSSSSFWSAIYWGYCPVSSLPQPSLGFRSASQR
jgi:F-type H+-transporting ATPase subunit a